MKTPLYSSAHQILRLGFKLWLDLALEGKACRGSSSLSYDISLYIKAAGNAAGDGHPDPANSTEP